MSKRLVLADSSAWVSHLSGHRTAASAVLGELLRMHQIATNDVVRLEVLTGALNESQYTDLADTFLGLHVLPLSDAVWRRAERLRFDLRQHGHLVPVPDVLIAACALLYDCGLIHADRHFDVIARIAPLQLYHPPLKSA